MKIRLMPLGALVAAAVGAWPGQALAADTMPPVITHTPPAEATAGIPLKIVAEMRDDSGIFDPKLHFRRAGAKAYLTQTMSETGPSEFSAVIPDTELVAGTIEYFIEAYDAAGNGPSRFASDAAPQQLEVKVSSLVAPPPPPVAPRTVSVQAESQKGSLAIPGGAVFGVGAAGLVAGSVLQVLASSKGQEAVNDPDAWTAREKHGSAKGMELGADIAFIVGGVAAAAGAALLVYSIVKAPEAAAPAKEGGFDAKLFIGPTGASLSIAF